MCNLPARSRESNCGGGGADKNLNHVTCQSYSQGARDFHHSVPEDTGIRVLCSACRSKINHLSGTTTSAP